MEGRGVTNYSTSKPSIAFTTSTTEFDDALLSRGIITMEQAMLAKGASPEEAHRLVQEKENEKRRLENKDSLSHYNDDDDDQSDDQGDDHSENDDENVIISNEEETSFLESYRKMRLSQLKNERNFGQVIPINRTDWKHEVNDASEKTWVIIHLTAQNSSPNLIPQHLEICNFMEDEIMPKLAMKFPTIKFVSIPSVKAIENFPEGNLPTLFCYRYGKLQQQLVGLQELASRSGISSDGVEWRLGKLGVLETDLDEDSFTSKSDSSTGISFSKDGVGDSRSRSGRNGRSRFDGGMATLATCGGDDDESDYDDVD